MLTALHDSLWTDDLLQTTMRPVVVYELALTAATLRYAPQALTWSSNTYSALAVKQSPITDAMHEQSSEMRVTFSNVTGALRAQIEPIDLLTGKTLTARLLTRDSGGTLNTYSQILYKGVMERPKRISETDLEIVVIDPINAAGVDIPRRRLVSFCPWVFADGVHCTYTNSTLANGAGSSSTALVVDAGTGLTVGDFITIGSGDEVQMSAVSGVNVTLAEARSWADNDPVALSRCNREFGDCANRAQEHTFGGFIARPNYSRLANRHIHLVNNLPFSSIETGLTRKPLSTPQGRARFLRPPSADALAPVPLVYGRRRTPGFPIEVLLAVDWDDGTATIQQKVSFIAVSEGVIDGIEQYYAEGEIAEDEDDGGTVKIFGIFYRVGGIGTTDTETQAEYNTDHLTQLRAQNIDYRTGTGTPYSETAYVIALQSMHGEGTIDARGFYFDIKGILCQKYTAAGATDGSPVWSENPLWQLVDLLTSTKHGLGMVAADLDFAVIKPEADEAETEIASTEASTLVTANQGTASVVCKVLSVEGFVAGRKVIVGATTNSVAKIVSDVELELGTAQTQVIDDTVIQKPPRYSSNLVMNERRTANSWVNDILETCLGYRTFAEGKVQFRVERGHATERMVNGGFENWSSATDADDWTEVTTGGTVNKSVTLKHGGAFCARLIRTGAGALNAQTTFSSRLVPGEVYRLSLWARGVTSLTNGIAWSFKNATQSKQLELDGTWAAFGTNHVSDATAVYVQSEVTFRVPTTYAYTDSYTIALIHNGTTGSDPAVLFDDVSIYGPIAGDFRDTGFTPGMGIAEGSFRWALEGKEREINRVEVEFVNDGADIGPDVAIANDFEHQKTNRLRVQSISSDMINDRDQAQRIADYHLAKARTLGPGASFVAGPAALATQPGDVVLVTHALPAWTYKPLRVVRREIIGLGDQDELFVKLEVEDYSEAIYSDVGVPARGVPVRPTTTLTIGTTVSKAGRIDMIFTLSDKGYAVRLYSLYKSATTGFKASPTHLWDETLSNEYTYIPDNTEDGTTIYFRVKAQTDRGSIISAEKAVAIPA